MKLLWCTTAHSGCSRLGYYCLFSAFLLLNRGEIYRMIPNDEIILFEKCDEMRQNATIF
jgi:hypothetical protein